MYLYVISRFHIHGLTIKWRAQNLLTRRMNELFYFNPKFGRIYVRTINRKRKIVSDLAHPEYTMNMCKTELLNDCFCIHDLMNDEQDDEQEQEQDSDTEDEQEEGEIVDDE